MMIKCGDILWMVKEEENDIVLHQIQVDDVADREGDCCRIITNIDGRKTILFASDTVDLEKPYSIFKSLPQAKRNYLARCKKRRKELIEDIWNLESQMLASGCLLEDLYDNVL